MSCVHPTDCFNETSRCEIACGVVALGLITMFVIGILGATKVIHMEQSAVGACLALPVFAIIVPFIIIMVMLENCRQDCSKGSRY